MQASPNCEPHTVNYIILPLWPSHLYIQQFLRFTRVVLLAAAVASAAVAIVAVGTSWGRKQGTRKSWARKRKLVSWGRLEEGRTLTRRILSLWNEAVNRRPGMTSHGRWRGVHTLTCWCGMTSYIPGTHSYMVTWPVITGGDLSTL